MSAYLSPAWLGMGNTRRELAKRLDQIVMLVGDVEEIPGVLGFEGQPLGRCRFIKQAGDRTGESTTLEVSIPTLNLP